MKTSISAVAVYLLVLAVFTVIAAVAAIVYRLVGVARNAAQARSILSNIFSAEASIYIALAMIAALAIILAITRIIREEA